MVIHKIITVSITSILLCLGLAQAASAQQLSSSIDSSYACSGFTGTRIPPNGNYKTTAFGCVNGFTDPNDNCMGACGNPPGLCNGPSGPDCERKLDWFAADADRYGCFSRLKITNPKTLKSAVVIVIDRGPACSQEQAFNAPIIDLSYTAAKYVGGSSGGNYEVAHVEKVSSSTPLGPTTYSAPTNTPIPTKKPSPTPTRKPTPTPTTRTSPTPNQSISNTPPGTCKYADSRESKKSLGTFTSSFSISKTSDYIVWVRMKASSSENNGFFLSVDNDCPELIGNYPAVSSSHWTWVNYTYDHKESAYVLTLNAGDHFLTASGYEPGVKIDRFLFVSTANICRPSDKDDLCLSNGALTVTPPINTSLTPNPTNLSPDPTSSQPNRTITSFSILLHGIGRGGDNANPQAFSFSNQDPIRKEREIAISAFDLDGNLISSAKTISAFNPQKGSYDGQIDLTNLEDGKFYVIKIKIGGYLIKKYDQLFTPNPSAILPQISLVAGDLNNDNKLDILDYNLLSECQNNTANQCSPGTMALSDLTDDGRVDIFDLNLFLRELTTTRGD